MQFTASQIRKWQKEYRNRCIDFGKKLVYIKAKKVHEGFIPTCLIL